MATVAHTPGPWVVEKVRDLVALHIMAAHRGPDSKFCVATTNSWADDQEADARLIAAAPDMLAALRDCLPLAAAFIALVAEGVAVTLFFGAAFVWLAIYATR